MRIWNALFYEQSEHLSTHGCPISCHLQAQPLRRCHAWANQDLDFCSAATAAADKINTGSLPFLLGCRLRDSFIHGTLDYDATATPVARAHSGPPLPPLSPLPPLGRAHSNQIGWWHRSLFALAILCPVGTQALEKSCQEPLAEVRGEGFDICSYMYTLQKSRNSIQNHPQVYHY